jgi:glucosamine kinase
MELFLGIDGGGTSCRAAIGDAAGRILGRGKSGVANIVTDPDAALANIAEAARAALTDAGLDAAQVFSIPAVLGLAGVNIAKYADAISARLPFARFALRTDSSIALRGALGAGDGVVAILGTGSAFLAGRSGQTMQVGGWGFILGDQGGGARIGRQALEEALLAHDRVVAASQLTDALLAEFARDPDRIVDFARHAQPADFGRFAPMAFEFAGRGDPVARRIIEAQAACVNASIDAVAWPGCGRLCLLGGLSPFYPPYLAERHRAILAEPLGSALDGAVALSVERFSRGAAA